MTPKKLIFTALTLFWMAVIFFFSAQPAKESAQVSGGVVAMITRLLSVIPVLSMENSGMNLEHIVRKAAHGTEFAILGALLFLAIREYLVKARLWLVLAFSCLSGILYAFTDEFHQLFVPGRSCQLSDVAIDSAGVFVGAGIIFVVFACICRKKELY